MNLSRAHCTRQLLAHGPLTFRDYWQITGWPRSTAWDVLDLLLVRGEVKRMTAPGNPCFLFGLA